MGRLKSRSSHSLQFFFLIQTLSIDDQVGWIFSILIRRKAHSEVGKAALVDEFLGLEVASKVEDLPGGKAEKTEH